MKFQFKVRDEDKLKRLQENQLLLLYEFFREKHCSGFLKLIFLHPYILL